MSCGDEVLGIGDKKTSSQVYPISQAVIDRARFLAGALELEWALHGVQSHDLSLLLVHLGRARDSLPILTPWA